MIYVYRRAASDGARELATALHAVRYRGLNFPIERKVRPNDVVVCWGESLTTLGANVRVLNGATMRSKYDDAILLRDAGIRTIEVSREQPLPMLRLDPAIEMWNTAHEMAEDFGSMFEMDPSQIRQRPLLEGIRGLQAALTQLANALSTPAPTGNFDWLGRANNHVGGNDLLNPGQIDYWARKEEFVTEVRIHSFLGRSIRAGVKAHREGIERLPHPWIRSWEAGWRIVYDGITARQAHRDLAHRAVRALGLDFGAVDIGIRADGIPVVLEVNRAPGLEGGTIDRYAEAIGMWVRGEEPAARPPQE